MNREWHCSRYMQRSAASAVFHNSLAIFRDPFYAKFIVLSYIIWLSSIEGEFVLKNGVAGAEIMPRRVPTGLGMADASLYHSYEGTCILATF